MIGTSWANEQLLSKYPLHHRATSDLANCIKDMRLYSTKLDTSAYISRLVVHGSVLTLTVSTDAYEGVGTAVFNGTDPVMTVFSDTDTKIGVMVVDVDAVNALFASGDTTLDFTADETRLCASVIIPLPTSAVTSLVVNEVPASGTVRLRGTAGVQLRASNVDGRTHLRVNAVGGTGYLTDLCGELSTGIPTRPVKTINGKGPDADGCFHIGACAPAVGGSQELLRIRPSGNSLLIYLVTQE